MTKKIYKSLCLLGIILILSGFAKAQTPPNAFNYSAVARNAAGQPIASATIGIQISILKTSTTGPVQYSENHFVNTDAFGLFNLIIGAGAVQTGSMSAITWGTDNYYIKVGMDAKGGTNFLTMGTTQLMSVPYALHAKTAETLVGGGTNTVGKTYIELFGDITNTQADSTLKADLGPNTQFVYITNTTKLTSIDLTAIKALMELSITGNEVLTTVNASSLTRCTKNFEVSTNPVLATIQTGKLTFLGGVYIGKNSKLTEINFPILKKAIYFEITDNPIISSFSAVMLTTANTIFFSNNGLTNINFPSLITLSENLTIEQNTLLNTLSFGSLKTAKSISIYRNGLTNLSFSALTTLSGSIGITNNTFLTSLDFGLLNTAERITIESNGLTGISFPKLTTLRGVSDINSNTLLNTLDISALNKIPDLNINNNKNLKNISWAPQIISWSYLGLNSNALPSSEINKILALVVAAGKIGHIGNGNSMFRLDSQTPPAPPTGQGITDKATIVGWGIYVNTDN